MLTTFYSIVFFTLGAVLGSFYNVLGYRLPIKKSIVKPDSSCPSCQKKLKFYDMIPILSWFILRGKCRFCKKKISFIYPFFEAVTALLFMLSYLVFGFSPELLLSLTFISLLVIISVSDIIYMIIPDEIVIIFGVLILAEKLIFFDTKTFFSYLIGGCCAFLVMMGLKFLGDGLFKKESLGGGDIKLMFIVGLTLGVEVSIMAIFLSSFLALPIATFILLTKKENLIPFGPYLALSSVILLLLKVTPDMLYNFFNLIYQI